MTNREIDSLIAEHVFGYKRMSPDRVGAIIGSIEMKEPWFEANNKCFMPHFYSERIADAWLVVEKMKEKYNFSMTYGEGTWDASFIYFAEIQDQESAPLAICLAALKSLGVKYE